MCLQVCVRVHVWGAFRREFPSSDGTTLTHTWLRSAWPHKAASETRRCPGQQETRLSLTSCLASTWRS